MKNFKIIIAYDGRRYKGFRIIKGSEDKTIQGKFESILGKLYEEKVEVISAVNTDAGVHAKYQVLNFKAPKDEFNIGKILNYMETFLPDDIIVLKVEEANERFHARYNVKSIVYEYRIWKSDAPHRPLFSRNQVKLMDKPLKAMVMEEAASLMVGEHDYRAYCTKSKVKSTVKNVQEVTVKETDNEIVIKIAANGYLINMERIMIGTLIQIGLYERDIESVEKAFSTLSNEHVGHKAMAGALCLIDIKY